MPSEQHANMSRRQAARVIAQSAASLLLARGALGAETMEKTRLTMLQRTIPSSGESLPVVGLGTWQVFDVGTTPAERRPLEEALAFSQNWAAGQWTRLPCMDAPSR